MSDPDETKSYSEDIVQSRASDPFKDVSGHGSARGGMARITLDSRGLVRTVEFDPKIRRLDFRDIAEAVRQALLVAQHDWRDQVATASAALDSDYRKLEQQLTEIDVQYAQRIEHHRRTMEELRRRMQTRD